MNKQLQSFLGLHFAVLLLGGTALFSKLIHLPAWDITALRSVFAATALLLIIKLSRRQLRLHHHKDYLLVILLGLIMAAHWITYFHAMQISSVAVGLIALYTFPVITVFIEPLFLGERPHWQDVVSGIMVIIGIYLMVPSFSLDNQISLGVFWGVLSAFLYALRNVLIRHYFRHCPAGVSLFYQILVVAIVVLPFLSPQVSSMATSQWALLVLLGVIFTALPHTLFAHSLVYFKAKTASLISCMQVVYATALAALILAEIPAITTIVGGVIIVTAAAYESFRSHR